MFLVLSSINGRSKRPEGGSYQLQVGQGEGKSILSLGIQRPDSPFSLYLVMEGILFLPLSFCCVCVCRCACRCAGMCGYMHVEAASRETTTMDSRKKVFLEIMKLPRGYLKMVGNSQRCLEEV